MRTISVNHLTAAVVLPLLCSSVWAGGLYIREFGHPDQGTSGAGFAVADDASVAFSNPASVFDLKGESESTVAAMIIAGEVEFDPDSTNTIAGDDGGKAGGILPGLSGFHTRRFADRWGFTLAMNSISGAALDYDRDFVGRYQGYEVNLLTVTLGPSLAYQVNDRLSVSLGAGLMFGLIDLKVAVPPLLGLAGPSRDGRAKIDDGDDFSATVTASLKWHVTDRTRVAVNYLGENELEFDGDLDLSLPGVGSGTTIGNISTDITITYPQMVAASVATDINESLTLTVGMAWEQWSALDSIPVQTSRVGGALDLDWDDVWSLRLGLRWKPTGPWKYHAGISYDSDPTNPADRLTILPVDRQWRYSGGANYALSEQKEIGVVLTYSDLGDARIVGESGAGRLSGDYKKNHAFFAAVNFSWH